MSDVVDRLRQRRDRVWNEAVELADRASEENRAFTPEEQTQYESREAELNRLDERIKSMLDGEERARDTEQRFAQLGGAHRPGDRRWAQLRDDDLEERFRRAIYDKSPAPIDVFPSERRAYYQPGLELRSAQPADMGALASLLNRLGIEQRVLTKGTATQALPVNVYDRVVMHLVEQSAVMGAGATVINTETGESLQVPKSTAFVSSALTGEGAAIAASDPTLAVSTLGAYKYASLFQIGRELATDSQSDILGFLARQAAISLNLAFGPHLITGTGTGQPQGVVTAAAVGKVGPAGTTVSLGAQATAGMGTDILYDLIGSLAEPYSEQPSDAFVMTTASKAIINKLKDSTGQPLPGNGRGRVLDYPAFVDPSVAQMAANAKSIVFGDWSRYFVRIAGGIRFERSDEYAFGTDLITFRCIIRLDGALVDANGIKVFQNSAT